jgi:AraC family transcriptional regulator
MAVMAELQQIIQLAEQSLDEPGLDAGELASRACLSRFHFGRLANAALGEPPGAFRRRLLLERTAHRLVCPTACPGGSRGAAGGTSANWFRDASLPTLSLTARRAGRRVPGSPGARGLPGPVGGP